MKTSRLLAVGLASALLCGAILPDVIVVPGETVPVGGSFIFYFKTGANSYQTMRDPAPVLANPSWSAGEGLALDSLAVGISRTPVRWSFEGSGRRYEYTTDGYRVSARAVVTAAADAAAGRRQIMLHLPGLSATAASLNAEIAEGADTPSEVFFRRPDTLEIVTVVVSSASGKFFDSIRGFIVPAILILIFLAMWLTRKKFAGSAPSAG